ncbi:MAG TPA: HipA N-terminal domain-containing protein [Williamwhitmania sp.]|nr:HipA N-terminal domain-containing protein [Williamwhitmania sp.]
MRTAKVFVNNEEAGKLTELEFGKRFRFEYTEGYSGSPVSLTMPLSQKAYEYDSFPPFFDGLLPEGYQLEGLLKFGKIDRDDLFGQLMAVGNDLIGQVTVKENIA